MGFMPMRVEDEVGVGEEKSGAEKERCGGEVAGDGGVDGFEFLAAGMLSLAMPPPASVRLRMAPKARRACSEWSRVRMDSVRLVVPFGLEACEEDRGFDLCGGDGGVEVDGVERAAVDGDGSVAFDEIDVCAHLREGLADALHGAEGEGVVADHGEGVRVRRDEAGEHAHGGAGVAAV